MPSTSSIPHDRLHGWFILLHRWAADFLLRIDCQELPVPVIHFRRDLIHAWGKYEQHSHTIALREDLLLWGKREHVREVFLHELIHAVVAHRHPGATPHGEEFRHYCALAAIPARTKVDFDRETIQTGVSPLQRKIRKLLALGKSSNVHEAAAAMQKARELMDRHGLSLPSAAVEDAAITSLPLGSPFSRQPYYMKLVLAIISRFYHCKPLIVSAYVHARKKTLYTIELFGRREDIMNAEYIYDFLLREGKRQYRQYKARTGQRGQRAHNSFMIGFYSAIREQLEKNQQAATPLSESEALILREHDAVVEQAMRSAYPRIRRTTSRSGSRFNQHSFREGRERGANLQIRVPVDGSSHRAPPLLPGS